jgi:hypothetical protein
LENAGIIKVVFAGIVIEIGTGQRLRWVQHSTYLVVVVLGMLYLYFQSALLFSFLTVVYCQSFLRFVWAQINVLYHFQVMQRFMGFADR